MNKLFFIFFLLVGISVSFAQKYHDQKILGYIPMYGASDNVDYEKLTHAVFAFLQPNDDGSIDDYDDYQQVNFDKYLLKTDGLSVVRTISIGGQEADLSTLSASALSIERFTDSLVGFCNLYNFRAVDLDWEGIQGQTISDQYAQLVDSLDKHLTEEGIELCIAVPFTSYYGNWIPQSALEKADWINVMAYDGTGTWGSSPFGNHSSFQHLLDGEAYWTSRGVDKGKMVIGLPFYGRTFASESGGLADGISYQEIVARYPTLGDDINQTPGDDLTFFNGPDLIKQKCQYLIDNDFHGALVWEMTQDATGYKSLFKHIICTYSDEPCPVLSVCSSADTTSGLVAQFNLDGNANEAYNKVLDAPIVTAESSYDRTSELDKAYFFENNSSIDLGTHADFDVQDHTFSMWLNFKQDTSDIQVIFSKWDEDASGSYIVYSYDERISVQYLTGTEDQPVTTWFNSNVKLAKNEWYHVVISHSYTNGTKIYLNGLNIFIDERQFNFQTIPEHHLRLGGWNFRGKIDELKIYNRELTACDIGGLFYGNYANDKVVCEDILTKEGCEELSINGTDYTSSGTYYQYFDQGALCDSQLVLNLTIHEQPYFSTPIRQDGDLLYVTLSDYDYQWINCTDNTPVENETSTELTVEDGGEYAIALTDDNCTFTSPCRSVVVAGINQPNAFTDYSIYPNPATDRLFIKGDRIVKVELYDALGTLVSVTNSLEVSIADFPKGFFTVILTLDNGDSFSRKLMIN